MREANTMNYTSKFLPRSTDQLGSAKMKRQLYMVLIVAAALFIAVRGGQLVGSYLRSEPAPAPIALAVEATEAPMAQNTASQTAEQAPQPKTIAADIAPVATMTHSANATNMDDALILAATNPPQIVVIENVVEASIVRIRESGLASDTAESADDLSTTVDVADADQQYGNVVSAPTETEAAEPKVLANSSRDVVVRVFAALGSDGVQRLSATTDDTQADATLSATEPQNEGSAGLNSLQVLAGQLARHSESPEGSIGNSVAPTSDTARQAIAQLFGGTAPPSDERPVTLTAIIKSVVETRLATDPEYAHEPAETLIQLSAAAYSEDAANNLDGASTSEVPSDAQTAETATTDAMDSDRDTREAVAQTLNEPVNQEGALGTQVASDTATDAEVATELLLVNPPESPGAIRYLVNGYVFSMAPGHSQHLPAGREWRVKFHPGGDFDDVELFLRSGTYEFRATSTGWQLSVTEGDAASR
jgi:hypothetical protein